MIQFRDKCKILKKSLQLNFNIYLKVVSIVSFTKQASIISDNCNNFYIDVCFFCKFKSLNLLTNSYLKTLRFLRERYNLD
jgi:hypothetical protein